MFVLKNRVWFFIILLILPTTSYSVDFSQKIFIGKAQAIADAQRDANRDIDTLAWDAIGCFGGIIGVAAAHVYKPPVPASALLGKSSGYVAYYSDEYHKVVQNIQTKSAFRGCATGYGIVVLATIWLHSQNSSPYY